MATWSGTLAPYREFARIGFVNILAFRLRYYTGIITYLLNVTVYYFIWTAVLQRAGRRRIARIQPGADAHLRSRGLDHPLVLLEHHRPGNGLRSYRRQDRHGADQARLGAGHVACARGGRIGVSPDPADAADGGGDRAGVSGASARLRASISRCFWSAVLGSFLLMGAINFLIGTCAIPLHSILSLIRAKYWLIELLSGLLIPMTFFPKHCNEFSRGCPSSTSPIRRCRFIWAN